MAKHTFTHITESPFEALVNRARRLRTKGETRKALVALRQACMLDERCAWVWTLYGALQAQEGRTDEAQRAFRHALWLRKNDPARARSTQGLIDDLGPSSEAALPRPALAWQAMPSTPPCEPARPGRRPARDALRRPCSAPRGSP